MAFIPTVFDEGYKKSESVFLAKDAIFTIVWFSQRDGMYETLKTSLVFHDEGSRSIINNAGGY